MMAVSRFEAITTVFRRAYSPSPGTGTPWPLFMVSLKNILFSRKKTPFLFLFLLLPLVVTLLIAGSLDTYRSPDQSAIVRGGRAWFQDILGSLFFPLLLPIVIAVYATGAIGEEVEGKTLPYLFTRPVYRSWILMAKTVSSFAAAALLGILALTLTFFVAVSITENPLEHLDELFGYWSAIGLVVLATGGMFLLFGVLIPRVSTVLIVVYLFVWETFLSGLLPSTIQKYSYAWYERAYIAGFIDRRPGFLEELLIDMPGAGEAATVMIVSGVIGFIAALFVVSYRDYNV
jgi:ABC-type transport system involved in multi-copper enzyme maturation permease subunit